MIGIVLIILLLVFNGVEAQEADCTKHTRHLQSELNHLNGNRHRTSGVRPTAPVLTGVCEQDRDILAQAIFDARIALKALTVTRRDPLATQNCDVYVPRAEVTRSGFCWVKP